LAGEAQLVGQAGETAVAAARAVRGAVEAEEAKLAAGKAQLEGARALGEAAMMGKVAGWEVGVLVVEETEAAD